MTKRVDPQQEYKQVCRVAKEILEDRRAGRKPTRKITLGYVKKGKPAKLSAAQLVKIRREREAGKTIAQLAALFGISQATLSRNLAKKSSQREKKK